MSDQAAGPPTRAAPGRMRSGITGDQMRVWRKKMEWKQGYAATQLGVTRRTLLKYEMGYLPVPMPIWRSCKLLWLSTDAAQRSMSSPLRPDLLAWLKTYATEL